LEKDRSIPPIESIEKTLRVKPIGSIRLFKRPEYMPQKKKNSYLKDKKKETEELGQEQGKIVNHATHAGKIGVSVDYKV
jgi:hypothetical protein